MRKLLIYDSQYGNTEKIALAISGKNSALTVKKIKDFKQDDLKDIEVLIVGSPTQGGRPTQAIQQFLDNIPEHGLKNVKVTAFDTRFREEDLNFALKMLVRTIGYAAEKIALTLSGKGGRLLLPPEGFFIKGKEGPLDQGELERAEKWLLMIHTDSVRIGTDNKLENGSGKIEISNGK